MGNNDIRFHVLSPFYLSKFIEEKETTTRTQSQNPENSLVACG